MTRLLFVAGLLLSNIAVQAQTETKNRIKKSEVLQVAPVPDTVHDDDGFYFFMRNLEGKEQPNPEVEAIKKSYPPKERVNTTPKREEDAAETDATPTIGQQYESNS